MTTLTNKTTPTLSASAPFTMSDDITQDIVAAMMDKMVVRADVDDDLLPDGSRRIFTLRRPRNEGLENDDANDVIDTLHFVATTRGLRWQVARDVEGGTILYDEAPLVYASFFDDTVANPLDKRTARRLLPKTPKRSATMQRLYTGEPDLQSGEVTPSIEWTLTYLFMTRTPVDQVQTLINQMPQPGDYARVHSLRKYLSTRGNDLRTLNEMAQFLENDVDAIAAAIVSADSVEAPTESVEAPTESVESPTESVEAPTESAEAPTESAEAPTESAEAPTESAEAPTDSPDPDGDPITSSVDAVAARLKTLTADYEANELRFKDDIRHIEAIFRGAVRRNRQYLIEDILVVYGVFFRNMLYMRSPLSQAMYGAAIYTGATHMHHACAPTANAYFGENGKLLIEAAGPLKKGTELSLDRLLSDPLIRCVTMAPPWIRRLADERIGFGCRCTDCVCALRWMRSVCAGITDNRDGSQSADPVTDQDLIAKVTKSVDATWHDPPLPLEDGAALDVEAVCIMLEQPMMMRDVANPGRVVQALGLDVLLSEFEDTTLRGLMLARFVLEAVTRVPQSMLDVFGRDDLERLVDRAGAYQSREGAMLVHGKLTEQGSSSELLARRQLEMCARVQYMWLAAAISIRVVTTIANLSTDAVQAALKREFADDAPLTERFNNVFKYIMAAASLSKSDVCACAQTSAADRLRYEMMQSGLVALAIRVMQLNDKTFTL